MYDPVTTGQVIRRTRVARGMSMSELARRVDTRHGHISQIERGKITAGYALMARIADVLELSIDDLLGREGIEEPADPEIDKVLVNLRAIRKLDQEGLDKLAELILAYKEHAERKARR
jgi:transcriptional regulator with XRE-family HTH domain